MPCMSQTDLKSVAGLFHLSWKWLCRTRPVRVSINLTRAATLFAFSDCRLNGAEFLVVSYSARSNYRWNCIWR